MKHEVASVNPLPGMAEAVARYGCTIEDYHKFRPEIRDVTVFMPNPDERHGPQYVYLRTARIPVQYFIIRNKSRQKLGIFSIEPGIHNYEDPSVRELIFAGRSEQELQWAEVSRAIRKFR